MKKLRFLFRSVLVAIFCCNVAYATKTRIQAEQMTLSNYKVKKMATESYIALTYRTGVASYELNLPSGKYDIEARFMSEKAGQNTYTMYLNGIQIISWLGKNRDDQWHFLSEQKWHSPRNIILKKGDKIRIETLGEKGSLAILDFIEFSESSKANITTRQNLVSVYPEKYEHAIRNPLMGFRGSPNKSHEYSTLNKTYIAWNEIENNENDEVDKILAVCDAKWRDGEKQNIKFIPRVYLDYPTKPSGWPADMIEGDFTSKQFKQRLLNLIKKLGQAWDNDSRVAYVEMGLIGQWGEMEFPDTNDEIKEAMAAQFAASFQNKIVMIRWPNTYNDDIFNFGYYWDSWGHYDQRYYGFNLNNVSPKWKTAVIGGEVAYDWGNSLIQPGKSPDVTLTTKVHRDFLINQARSFHANYMGWVSSYDQKNESSKAGADLLQKAMGYQFVISEVNYSKRINPDTKFTVSFTVKNTGSTPIYYNWPVEVSLLDPVTKQPVWKQICTDLDIRNWLPGDKWNASTAAYSIPPEINRIRQAFTLSKEIPYGEYIIALAILDPAGNRPAARFSIKNYFNGGRHPIGKIGVNTSIDSFEVTGFDDIQSDKSLFYDKVVK